MIAAKILLSRIEEASLHVNEPEGGRLRSLLLGLLGSVGMQLAFCLNYKIYMEVIMNIYRRYGAMIKGYASCVGMLVPLSLFLFTIGIANPAFAEVKNPTDKELTNAVEFQLKNSPAVDANYIDVETDDRIVTLSGTVPHLLTKEKADEIAQNIEGVEAVIDQTEVKPIERPDEEIKESVKKSIQRDPALDLEEVVQVRVIDGKVVLVGMVQSRAELQLCEDAAKKVKGVKEVDNQLTVRFQAKRTDQEIQNDVSKRLKNDVLVRGEFIDVAVKDGVVTLSGTICSAGEKRRAEELAWIHGVRNVKTDLVNVDCGKYNQLLRQKRLGEEHVDRPDRLIKEAVRDALSYDPRVEDDNITITVEEGVVTLGNVVDNLRAKKAAIEDAKNTVGVWRVVDLIKVRPKEELTVNEIAENLRQAIREDPYLENRKVRVVVHDNTAYLSGKVDSHFEKQHAEQIAWGIDGVIYIKNNIIVGSEWVGTSDWEIEQDIKSELWWSPYVDSEQVKVEVENNIATLTGTVDTWTERTKAVENAYEGGAKQVINKLETIYGPE